MIQIELPYPPSTNRLYRRVGPRTLISREGRRYRERVCAILARLELGCYLGRLRLEIEAYPPDHRRRDADNLQKCLLDSLQHGGLYVDDSQIKELKIEMRGCVQGGRLLIYLAEVADV